MRCTLIKKNRIEEKFVDGKPSWIGLHVHVFESSFCKRQNEMEEIGTRGKGTKKKEKKSRKKIEQNK